MLCMARCAICVCSLHTVELHRNSNSCVRRARPNSVLVCDHMFAFSGNTTATCNFTACSVPRASCSSNPECECHSLTAKPSTGICASAFLSCSSVVRCNTDNKTCPIEGTVCVNSTRCGKPVCYPLPLADRLICPAVITSKSASCAQFSIACFLAEQLRRGQRLESLLSRHELRPPVSTTFSLFCDDLD